MKKHGFFRKALSILLVLVLTASCLPISRQVVSAASYQDAYGSTDNKIADPHTVNNWKLFFDIDDPNNLNTAYAGGVWTDKSVFNTVAEYLAATDENDSNLPLSIDENSFLVALSAIASTKSVEGYSSLPSDTVLVLDLSASMVSNQAVGTLVASANDAITRLQSLNANNRVGVIAYSGRSTTGVSATSTAEVILPLGRYTPGLDGNNRSAYLVSNWTTGSGRDRVNHTGVKVANGVTGVLAEGVTDTFSVNNAKDAEGGTYIQNGLFKAWEMFEKVQYTQIQEGIQAGVGRVPVLVLMSDGAATTATTDYTNVGSSNAGNGGAAYATNGIAFITQLTAAWVRDNLQKKYNASPLVYTLGLNVGSNAAANNLLDPSHNTGTDDYWETFRALANANQKSMSVSISNNSSATVTYTDPVGASWDENYVTEYFPASNSNALGQAFSDIVQQIIIQSLYYPTMVEGGNSIDEDGFLVFNDYIGSNMEVKAIKGIQLGSTLYSGKTLAMMIYQGGMGTVENPTDVGNNLVWSVQKRLGLPSVQAARELIGMAYSSGQLFYDPDTGDFSNYIGWYADENEQFVGFWDGKDDSAAAVPDAYRNTAKYAIKSYGFYDAVGEGHRKTDMMYATIQVRTTVRSTQGDAAQVGDTQVIGKLPASLIPLVEFDVQLNGTDVLDPSSITAKGATAPSRLLYEVGLDNKIDLLDIAGTAPDALETDPQGNYVFYTNQWHSRAGDFTYATNKNTLSYFEPSYENERYFYNYDAPIYTDTRGTLYTGSAAPTYSDSNTYYHRFITYYKENGAVRAQYDYEPISQYVLDHDAEDLQRMEDDSWVVKRGTLHHYFADYEIHKTQNATDTLDVSFMPFTHDLEVSATTDHFHVDFYLGNNGKLTLDPTEGLKITKISDDTLTDKTADYRFTVTTDAAFSETLRFVKQAADGSRTESTIAFAGGVATLTLKHGESAWILGEAMAGKTFTVTEDQGDGYVVSSVNGITTDSSATLAVTANTIPAAEFVNTRQQTGTVTIGKGVTSHLQAHQSMAFSFTVTISGDKLVAGREYTMLRSDGQSFAVTPDTPTTFTLTHNQYVTISALPIGTTVTATEADYSSLGFTVNQATQSTTVEADKTKYLNFGNTYSAAPVQNGNTVTVGGIKHLVSDADLTATFNFRLERFIYAGGTYDLVDESSVTYQNETGDKPFTFNFAAEPYTAAGTYYYRISEVRNDTLAGQGIIFDADPAFFTVEVADDGQGSLYIANVIAGTDATVSGDVQNGFAVTSEFTNTYAVDGAAKVVVNIQKLVEGNQGVTIPPAGFSFELYEADADFNITGNAPAFTSPVTGAGGLTDIQLIFDDAAADIGTHYYVLKEHIPADEDKIPGITYTTESFGLKVEVGHENGSFTVVATTYNLSSQPAQELGRYAGQGTEGVVSAQTDALVFKNTFRPSAITLYIPGNKTLIGKDSAEGFSFTCVNDAGYGYTATNPVTTQDHVDGVPQAFSFGWSWNTTGTFTYEVRELIPAGAVNNVYEGITYDPSVFRIVVTVTGDNQTGQLSASYVVLKDGQTVPGIDFVNRYTAQPVTVTLEASKHLEGNIRKLQAGAFQFRIKEEGGDYEEIVRNGVPTDSYNAPITFSPLTFTQPGEYRYIITEVRPAEATNQNNYTVNGVKYSSKQLVATVTVTDNGKGQLEAAVQCGNDVVDSVFTNTYKVSPTTYSFGGTKVLTGDKLSNHTFTFDLYDAPWDSSGETFTQGDLVASAQCDASGNFTFGPFTASAIGAHRYILRERIPADPDPLMHYDTSYYVIEVDALDDLQGSLTTRTTITRVDPHGQKTEVTAGDVVFRNTMDPESVTVDLGGIKLYNVDLPADTFSFDLYQALAGADGSITPVGDPILNAFNKADGTFQFQEVEMVDQLSGTLVMSSYLNFSAPGSYHFVVKENIPDEADENHVLNGVTYDESIYTITVIVTESVVDGRTTLSAQMLVNGAADGHLSFTNRYDASASTTVIFSGTKYLTGRDLTDGEFGFGLYHATVDDQGKVTLGQNIETVTNANGIFTFSPLEYLTYTDAGWHFYVIREEVPDGIDENGKLGSITYDLKQYLAGVEVTDNGDGTLSVSNPTVVLMNEDGTASETMVSEIFFRNTYTYTPPQTGDNSNITPYTILLGIGLAGILGMGMVLLLSRKKPL